MEHLVKKTITLVDKAQKLVDANLKLRKANEALQTEVRQLKQTLEAEELKNSELNNKIKIIKLAQNMSPASTDENAGKAELKRKINEYLREIDNCIAMLNE